MLIKPCYIYALLYVFCTFYLTYSGFQEEFNNLEYTLIQYLSEERYQSHACALSTDLEPVIN